MYTSPNVIEPFQIVRGDAAFLGTVLGLRKTQALERMSRQKWLGDRSGAGVF